MKWKKFTIHTTSDAEDLVSGMLYELGITSIEIADKKPVMPEENGGYFGEVVPEMPEDDHKAEVMFYTDEDTNVEELIAQVKEGLTDLKSYADIGEGSVTEDSTDEEDWVNNWKQYFHSFSIDDIYIEPTWEEGTEEEEAAKKDASMILKIDPGTAFGTGKHETTQLAIRALRKYVKEGDEFLDIGTGSGILGIIALKSGAKHVFGTDLDDNTLPAITDNLKQNGISDEQFTRILGNIIDEKEAQDAVGYHKYDVVVANIIAEILAEITPHVPPTLKDGGIYITSGILSDRENLVIEAGEKAGLSVVEVNRMGDWSCIVFSYSQKM